MNGKGLKEFLQHVKQENVRFAYQWQMQINGPNNPALDMIQFYAQSANKPGRTIESSEMQYQGMTLRVLNNVTYESPWPVNVRCDLDMKILDAIEEWHDEYADLKIGGGGKKSIPDYNIRIDLLDATLQVIKKTYVLVGVYPESYGELTLSHEDTSISVFDVNFAYQYFYDEAKGDPLGSASQA